MKKTLFILALAMLAFFTQCKKQEPTNDGQSGNGIQMVLKADNGGSRTSFGPDGAISWSANDKIYVVANGQCVGHVTNGAGGGSAFTGTLSLTTGTYDFHYYYMGTEQTIADGATTFTMDFSNQDGTLAGLGKFHVGYGTQTGVEVTAGETVNAQASMKTLVAMAYFDIAGMAETGEKVFFYGDHINNRMNIDFSDNTTTFDKVSVGWICAGEVSSGAYVVLLPNHTDGTEELPTDITFVSKRTTGTCNSVFNYGIIGGRFYCAGGDTDMPIAVSATAYAQGTLRGEFSVSETKKVRFSQGNLQYIGSAATPYWQFAENQIDYLGWTTGQNSDSESVDRDFFGWGTSGYNHGAIAYQPWSTSTTWTDYYAYGNSESNFYDSNGQADWGYNAISNGGNAENSGWHTLNVAEWLYIIQDRPMWKHMHCNVNEVNGIVLLPDELPVEWSLFPSSTFNTSYTEEWALMEAFGAVFLPAAGFRWGADLLYSGTWGQYWLSDSAGEIEADIVRFQDNGILSCEGRDRHVGGSVRLVRDAE